MRLLSNMLHFLKDLVSGGVSFRAGDDELRAPEEQVLNEAPSPIENTDGIVGPVADNDIERARTATKPSDFEASDPDALPFDGWVSLQELEARKVSRATLNHPGTIYLISRRTQNGAEWLDPADAEVSALFE